MLTNAIEDYIKTIYHLCTNRGKANTNQIAEALQVTPASVSGMLRKLAHTDPPLVSYHKHRGVTLTPDGERVALEVIRHHRLLETFLHQILGYEWHEVHAEADRLEHVISEEFEARMAQALGYPTHDPHGDPIPSPALEMPHRDLFPLGSLRPSQSGIVARVNDADPQLLCYLSERGIVPQAHLTVLAYSPFDRNLSLQIHGQDQVVVLGPAITAQIFMEIPA
ncbi:MAG: metal-dependent transcriptional regulator [Anaerolineales bacterium]